LNGAEINFCSVLKGHSKGGKNEILQKGVISRLVKVVNLETYIAK
jgi:hypothetical protein